LQSDNVHDPNREKDSKTYLHTLGTDPAKDKEVFSRELYPDLGIKPEDFPVVEYNRHNQYLFGFAFTVDSRLKAYYAPANELMKERINWKPLFKPEDEVYWFASTYKDIYIYTPKDAPNFKLLKTNLRNPDLATATVVIPENAEKKLEEFAVTKEGVYYTLSSNGVEKELYRIANGKTVAEQIPLPFKAGSIYLQTKNFKYPDVWIYASGWTNDQIRYRYLSTGKVFKEEHLSSKAQYPEYQDLVVEELMVPSHDGVKVPLSLVYKKGIQKNGNNPVLFIGYGAYGASMNPFFSPNFLLFTHAGGIFAIAHVRGGGELGDKWYKSGFKTTKYNTWKDLIACADYMVKEKYTSPKKIAINSASAGGILIGRAMTERPDLFAAAIPEVGCMNPVRAENSPNGPVNVPEFGTVKDSAEFMALLEMDAYHHIKDGENYPATLVTAGINDPRVIAWQPAKFAARLRSANKSGKPILFLPDFQAGHGIGDTKTKQFESIADVLAFALWQTGHKDFRPNE
jgi:prolyl oligopeptidase